MLIYNYICLNRGANDWPIYCQLVLLAFAKAAGYFRENLIRVPSAATFIVLEMDRGDNWTSHLTFYTTNKNTPKFREFKVETHASLVWKNNIWEVGYRNRKSGRMRKLLILGWRSANFTLAWPLAKKNSLTTILSNTKTHTPTPISIKM